MSTNPFRTQPTPAELYTPVTFAEQAQAALLRSRATYGVGHRMEDEPAEDEPAEDTPADDKPAPDEKVDLSKLPADVQAMVKRYRTEAAEASGKARDDAKAKAAKEAQDALMADIGKKLGFIEDDKKLTPEEFQRQLTEAGQKATSAQEAARETQVQLAVYRSANKVGGDPEALLDSRAFLAEVSGLDPAAKDFDAKVSTAIKTAVEKNSKLGSRAGAGSSSADHGAGGSGEREKREAMSLTDAVSGHYRT